MLCVTTMQYNVTFNGMSVGPINPSRGLRQGDPLSHYLFLLCVEGLSNSLEESTAGGSIHGCQISTNAPPLLTFYLLMIVSYFLK